jgi:hypothetical protein
MKMQLISLQIFLSSDIFRRNENLIYFNLRKKLQAQKVLKLMMSVCGRDSMEKCV